uniref:NADH-ubiquinone oxidoreductase chain 4 n=1 Tax=Anodonta anatina TaxID=143294 RepID=A0A023I1R1_ANOAN|nr:NADH dehydrogenase subunit 4 [Anodonta anatina]AGS17942.1 NADH dehydrogenase subunit 4 [Anodonta anatina]
MIFSSLFLVSFVFWLIGVGGKLGWWVSVWISSLITEVMICVAYTSVGVSSCSYGGVFNCDELSCAMIWLSALVYSLSLLSSNKVLSESNGEVSFLICLLVLMMALMVSFSINSLLMFYVFFEFSLIPTFLIICGWGYQPERLRASKFMVLYTVGASLPLLMFILCVIYAVGSVEISLLNLWNVEASGFFVFTIAILAFLVKVPMYGLHMWLPKAHVEAPVAGSMMLAGVLLKLGSYGLARFMQFFKVSDTFFLACVMCLCIFGGMVGSLICCFQIDVKSLVAYSSVGHMSLVLCGLMSSSLLGFVGSCLLMVAHGLSSPGMFYLVSEMYKLFGSRSMFLVRGMTGNLMGVNVWLMFMCGFNAAAPPSLSICSEVILYISLISYSMLFSLVLGFMSFLSCLYSWSLYCSTQAGNYPSWVRSSSDFSSMYLQSIICGSLSFGLVGLCFLM